MHHTKANTVWAFKGTIELLYKQNLLLIGTEDMKKIEKQLNKKI